MISSCLFYFQRQLIITRKASPTIFGPPLPTHWNFTPPHTHSHSPFHSQCVYSSSRHGAAISIRSTIRHYSVIFDFVKLETNCWISFLPKRHLQNSSWNFLFLKRKKTLRCLHQLWIFGLWVKCLRKGHKMDESNVITYIYIPIRILVYIYIYIYTNKNIAIYKNIYIYIYIYQ